VLLVASEVEKHGATPTAQELGIKNGKDKSNNYSNNTKSRHIKTRHNTNAMKEKKLPAVAPDDFPGSIGASSETVGADDDLMVYAQVPVKHLLDQWLDASILSCRPQENTSKRTTNKSERERK